MPAAFRTEGKSAKVNVAPVVEVDAKRDYSLKLKRNSISGVCRVAVLTAVYFLTYPYMLHHLGTERFGMWALALVIAQSLGTQDLGISGALMSFIPEHWSSGGSARIQELASTALFLLAGIGTILGIGVFFFRDGLVNLLKIPAPLRNEMSLLLVTMTAVFFFNLLSSGLTAVLIGIHRMDISNITYTSAAVVQAFGVFFVLHRGYGLLGLSVSYMCTACLWGLTTWIMLQRCLPNFQLGISQVRRADALALLRYGSNIQAAGLGSFLTVPPIKILLSRYVSLSSVSSFELASGMAMQLRSLFLMAAMPLIPASAHFSSEKATLKLATLYKRSFRYIALVALPVFSVTALLAPGFTEFWLHRGTPYVAATLGLLLLGWFFNTLMLPAYFMLQGQKFARYQVYVASLQAICSALCGYVLVRFFGYYGAVAGLGIGLTVAAVYILWQYPRICPDDASRLVDKSVLVALSINAVLAIPFLFQPHWREVHNLPGLILVPLAYLSVYVSSLFTFGALSQVEQERIKFFWSGNAMRVLQKRPRVHPQVRLETTSVAAATKWTDK
jgi:O-antigen/teichoic acid export membrane protein